MSMILIRSVGGILAALFLVVGLISATTNGVALGRTLVGSSKNSISIPVQWLEGSVQKSMRLSGGNTPVIVQVYSGIWEGQKIALIARSDEVGSDNRVTCIPAKEFDKEVSELFQDTLVAFEVVSSLPGHFGMRLLGALGLTALATVVLLAAFLGGGFLPRSRSF